MRFKPGPVSQDALDYLRDKDLRVGFDHEDVWREEHAHAFTVAKAMQIDLLDDIKASVETALAEGRTYREFARELTPILQRKGWWGRVEQIDPVTGERREVQLGSPRRLKTIYRSNMRSARAAGQWQRVQRHKDTHPYLLYLLGPSEQHRPQHVRWAGTMLPVDHPWWREHYPPNGWGCKCHVRQVSRREAERLERDGVQDPDAPQEIDGDTGLPTGRRQDRRLPVRTEPPERDPRQYTNKRTGEAITVDAGVDPAWSSNPGMDRVRVIREHLTGRVATADAQLAHAAAEQVMASDVMAQWAQAPRGELPAGVLTRDLQDALGSDSHLVRLSDATLTKQGNSHPELTAADYAVLPDLVRRGIAIRQDGQRLVLFRKAGNAWWKAVVKVTGDQKRLYLVSFHRADARELRRERDRGTVLRSVEQ
ncbi:phage head morphogenesis protein [Arhodomonas sp. AD133]|uniref:phage head morphogenesis protein n=1 Tax=Arhodomonas sp. AD133 TaxID=3415009 RepID=UPI003EC05F7E